MKNIKTEFNRDHYYYHRIDPTPWIPIEDEEDDNRWVDGAVFVASIWALLILWWLL